MLRGDTGCLSRESTRRRGEWLHSGCIKKGPGSGKENSSQCGTYCVCLSRAWSAQALKPEGQNCRGRLRLPRPPCCGAMGGGRRWRRAARLQLRQLRWHAAWAVDDCGSAAVKLHRWLGGHALAWVRCLDERLAVCRLLCHRLTCHGSSCRQLGAARRAKLCRVGGAMEGDGRPASARGGVAQSGSLIRAGVEACQADSGPGAIYSRSVTETMRQARACEHDGCSSLVLRRWSSAGGGCAGAGRRKAAPAGRRCGRRLISVGPGPVAASRPIGLHWAHNHLAPNQPATPSACEPDSPVQLLTTDEALGRQSPPSCSRAQGFQPPLSSRLFGLARRQLWDDRARSGVGKQCGTSDFGLGS